MGHFLIVKLDRDPGRWKLDPMIQERRRSVFLVLYLLDNYFVRSCHLPYLLWH